MISAFRTEERFGWHQHDATLFHETERSFLPDYEANLVIALGSLSGTDASALA